MASDPSRTRAERAPSRATAAEPGDTRGRRDLWAGLDQSTAMSMELLAGILVWGGVGWVVDGWLGTRPWLFVAGTLLGFAAGLYLVLLRARAMERERDRAHGEREPAHGEREPAHGERERRSAPGEPERAPVHGAWQEAPGDGAGQLPTERRMVRGGS